MNSLSVETHAGNHLSPSQQPFTPPPGSTLLSLNNMVSPTILLIIIILAIVFFISGLLHLLVRFLPRPSNRDPDEFNDATALEGPLQQLFHLHDSGVDQTFIDTLPIFSYKSVIGVKNSPFDCAVCLCEFDSEDKLRLLPKCSHAFHMDCIDTWLLSHSTCPLCRSCLLSDLGTYGYNNCSPVVLVLESGSEGSREIVSEREGDLDGFSVNSHLGVEGVGAAHDDISRKSCEIQVKEEGMGNQEKKEEKVVIVKLGKFKNVDGRYREESSGGANSTNVDDGRRCFSMGSYEYVMDEDTSLKVPIKTPIKKLSSKKPSLPLIPGKKLAMSECDCESRRYFEELEGFGSFSKYAATSTKISSNPNNVIGKSKRESFSLSRIWTRGKKKNPNSIRDESSSQASSFRFPLQRNVVVADETKPKNYGNDSGRTASEIGIGRWENPGSELGCDEENQSCNSLDSQANPQSFTTRTLLWLLGKQNKVVHSSYPPGL